MTLVTITESYSSAYPDPIRLSSGDAIVIGKTDSEWPGWYWCTDKNGKAGWVFEFYLELIDDSNARVKHNYDGTELTVSIGDKIEVEFELGGWVFGVAADGRQGWVPAKNTNWQSL